MAGKNIDAKQKRFIEDIGVLFEGSGLPRMAGRVFGWLLICNPPHQSASQLAAVVEGSKGSISTATRMLTTLHLAQRMTLPGNRSTYYQIMHGAWNEMLHAKIEKITLWREAAERGIHLMKHAGPESRQRLEEMRDIHALFEHKLPLILQRWEQRHTNSIQPKRTGA